MKNKNKIINIVILIIFVCVLLLIYYYIPNNNMQNKNKELLNLKMKSPEIAGLTNWINSEPIESIESLKGKVVLVDFWTYSCINCIRTLPYLQDLQEKYSDKGLVIIGIHAPEFAFERIPENVKKASKKYNLTYPIVQDNDFKTWKNFNNRYWPAKYLIDKEGFIRYTHFGEGNYKETENAILELLGIKETKNNQNDFKNKTSKNKTPETYLGNKRRENFQGTNREEKLKVNQWIIFGNWKSDKEKIFSDKIYQNEKLGIKIQTQGREANLVMGGNAKVKIFIDGLYYKDIEVKNEDLFNIFKFKENKIREVLLEFSGENIKAFAWTFG